ncbi:MAG: ATP synthase F0 subunit B [Proteobacteria bacterium]|nr:ATP synthase F0 subunit B [Pseudomonadota bacterium]
MASGLNLTPDITVLGVQAGLFLANMFVVKKLMLEPYLKVRELRDQKTGGSQDSAQALLQKAKELDAVISQKMKDAHKGAAELREKIKSEANQVRATLVTKAELEAKSDQQALLKSISENLKEEKSRLDQTVSTISDELVRLAIS